MSDLHPEAHNLHLALQRQQEHAVLFRTGGLTAFKNLLLCWWGTRLCPRMGAGFAVFCLCVLALSFSSFPHKQEGTAGEEGCRSPGFPAWWGGMSSQCLVPAHLILCWGSGTSSWSVGGQERALELQSHWGGGSTCATPAHGSPRGDIPVAREDKQLRLG